MKTGIVPASALQEANDWTAEFWLTPGSEIDKEIASAEKRQVALKVKIEKLHRQKQALIEKRNRQKTIK